MPSGSTELRQLYMDPRLVDAVVEAPASDAGWMSSRSPFWVRRTRSTGFMIALYATPSRCSSTVTESISIDA